MPGTVAGLSAMHERFGKSAWKDLIAPAIRLANEGVRISTDQQVDVNRAKIERNIAFILNSPFVQKELAATLQRIAEKGAADFYDGELAARIVEGARAGGGIISLRDLRDYFATFAVRSFSVSKSSGR